MAATRPHNVVPRGKTKPCSLILAFGSEERFENSALRFAIHADASIGHRQHHVISPRQRGRTAGTRRFGDVRGFQCKLSALRHGIAGVDHEIHDDLLDLSGIGADTTSLRIELDHEFHFIAQHSEKHLAHVVDQGIEVKHLWAEYMLPAEGKQLPCQAGCTLRGADDGFYILAHGRSRAVFLHHDFRVSANDHEQVVEVVCNPARQPVTSREVTTMPPPATSFSRLLPTDSSQTQDPSLRRKRYSGGAALPTLSVRRSSAARTAGASSGWTRARRLFPKSSDGLYPATRSSEGLW